MAEFQYHFDFPGPCQWGELDTALVEWFEFELKLQVERWQTKLFLETGLHPSRIVLQRKVHNLALAEIAIQELTSVSGRDGELERHPRLADLGTAPKHS